MADPGSQATKDAARGHFDRQAAGYERRYTPWIGRFQRAALESLELTSADRLLDVSCGTGKAVRLAAPVVEWATGVDLSPAMIGQARALAQGRANVEFVEGDSEQLPFADGTFTAVICTTAFHHFPHPATAVAEMARVLAPGGRVALADIVSDSPLVRLLERRLRHAEPGHVRLYRREELRRLLLDAGFSEVVLRRLMREFYVLAAGRKPRPASQG